MTVRRAAEQAVSSVLARGGLELRRRDRGAEARDDQVGVYVAQARAIEARHAAQTVDDVEALRRKYAAPVFGEMRVWDLVERLAQCVDPSDCSLFCTSQQTHILQMLEAMALEGVDDPELLLAVLIHDLGKLLLVAGEDPANVVCMNAPIGDYEPGIGLDQCTFQWNHDEFGWSRLRDHVPDGVAWLVRYHSMDADAVASLMDERDREHAARYFDVFTRFDHDTKTPYHLPAVRLAAYRDLVEDAFPQPIPF